MAPGDQWAVMSRLAQRAEARGDRGGAGRVALIGSETDVSIVSRTMRCGTTGLRPTFGRVPHTGAMTLCWSLDKLGAITRGVEDTMRVLGPSAA